jgi:hypothetical protein
LSSNLLCARKAAAAVAFAALTFGASMLSTAAPAVAVPIFAERYGFSCSACHTAVPELNAFGNAFRRAGFNLPNAPRHRDFPLALRFSENYTKDLLPSQTRRFNAMAILISTANFGADRSYSYFARYLFGTQGAAGSLYFAWAQHVNPVTGVFERVGLFNLPLIANATQRLDTISPQSVYTYTVGHSSANLATPRLGVLFGQRNNSLDAEIAISEDEYHGAAYGAPTPPSDLAQAFAVPEVFGSALFTLPAGFKAGVLGLSGSRAFQSRSSASRFYDSYQREGVQASWTHGQFDLAAQQLWGNDDNADGFGHASASSGGFVTLKYRPSQHSYVGVRYDAVANPFISRDYDVYAVFAPTIHSRFVIEHLTPIGSPNAIAVTSAQLLFALPFTEPARPH